MFLGVKTTASAKPFRERMVWFDDAIATQARDYRNTIVNDSS